MTTCLRTHPHPHPHISLLTSLSCTQQRSVFVYACVCSYACAVICTRMSCAVLEELCKPLGVSVGAPACVRLYVRLHVCPTHDMVFAVPECV